MSSPPGTTVDAILERSRRLGFLGPGSVRVHVEHALGFARGIDGPPARLLDLGSGGGVPGLVLALQWTETVTVLLDASERRCAFLTEAVASLGCGDRVTVVRSRAERAGRRDDLRGQFEAVVARGFGPPAVTAECGAPFLAVDGRLVVSEPPGSGLTVDHDRWPSAGLSLVGLRADRAWDRPYHYRSFVQERPCPPVYPRRDGVPGKRPLF